MQIKQWEDKNLAHFSYGILSDDKKQLVLIDPARDPHPYLEYAKQNASTITAIIETHPHADFVSGHLELMQRTGAKIYTHSLVAAAYPHKAFDEGSRIELGKIVLTSIYTPGHSADSISILLEYNGKQKAVFTGDTLFIGDCGRPDLREGAGNIQSKREDLARQMYHSLREKLMVLDDDVLVYPAHGAGTLCGKSLSDKNSSTIGTEKQTNWSLQEAAEDEFVRNLLKDQPFIPAYFPYNVEVNRKGAAGVEESLSSILFMDSLNDAQIAALDASAWIIDARDKRAFKEGHLPHSINLGEDGKFETWLGSIIMPGEHFYLAGDSEEQLHRLFRRIAAIGYESQIKLAFVLTSGPIKEAKLNVPEFSHNKDAYTIIDVRNDGEAEKGKPFPGSIAIPLHELRQKVASIPTNKPIVVHCTGGYRSAAASSLISSALAQNKPVYDLSEDITRFM
jgi:glyoxylase-like metal-dependent hydrolase (beta-lactamase superfamily II)/rhodanese-related sulfurtransferase